MSRTQNKSQALPAFAGLQLSRALDNSDSNGIIHPSRIIVNESQTWLGKETSGQIHDNNVEKERLLSQAQTVSLKKNECDRDCKRVEGIVQKTFKNIKNLAERAKENVSQTFHRQNKKDMSKGISFSLYDIEFLLYKKSFIFFLSEFCRKE